MLSCPCHPAISKAQRQDRLGRAVSILDDQGPADAYESLRRRGEHHVPHLGPAFFSKIIYFADKSWTKRGAHDRPPGIILDGTTARRMIWVSEQYMIEYGTVGAAEEAAMNWVWASSDWSEHRYDVYCRWAFRCVGYMARKHDWPREADMIELALFTPSLDSFRDATGA
jgi:hypothetical protein